MMVPEDARTVGHVSGRCAGRIRATRLERVRTAMVDVFAVAETTDADVVPVAGGAVAGPTDLHGFSAFTRSGWPARLRASNVHHAAQITRRLSTPRARPAARWPSVLRCICEQRLTRLYGRSLRSRTHRIPSPSAGCTTHPDRRLRSGGLASAPTNARMHVPRTRRVNAPARVVIRCGTNADWAKTRRIDVRRAGCRASGTARIGMKGSSKCSTVWSTPCTVVKDNTPAAFIARIRSWRGPLAIGNQHHVVRGHVRLLALLDIISRARWSPFSAAKSVLQLYNGPRGEASSPVSTVHLGRGMEHQWARTFANPSGRPTRSGTLSGDYFAMLPLAVRRAKHGSRCCTRRLLFGACGEGLDLRRHDRSASREQNVGTAMVECTAQGGGPAA
ncbi:uncharacterized protein C8Q71DRAFT_477113 [Rhodofomes roseus]|uniref:Uncharacterized protein n=1 Tax=Rhodofomes roseus TaxID=34475 RepID=A0ABQ8KQE1_9APHY|nr:uncharacterized protein C8Q71DRAFT_477113 [Rhodofomes roseus]KAH9840097.1 hypothetical protein C8Q71DRAFT_477113 [Rhodofomes roseus]